MNLSTRSHARLRISLVLIGCCLSIGLAAKTHAQGGSSDPAYPGSSSPGGSSPGGSSSSDGGRGGSSQPAEPAVAQPNLTTGPTPMGLYQLVQPDWKPLRQELARLMVPSTTPQKPLPTGPTLRNEAMVAFRYGNLKLARELYFGFLARGGKAATEDLESLKFSGHFRRPVWQVRWGVSLGLHGDTEITNFSPILVNGNGQNDGQGDDRNAMSSSDSGDPRGQNSNMSSSSDMSSPSSSSSPDSSPSSSGTTSPSGSSDSRDMSSSSGGRDEQMGSGMDPSRGSGMQQYDGSGRPIDAKPAIAAAPEAQITDESIEQRFEEVMGSVATTLADGMKIRFERGQFGPAFASVSPESTEHGDTVDGEYVSPSEPRMWIPNMVYMGEGSSQELTKTATAAGLDLLLHFDVALKEVRNSIPQNLTRVRVIDVRDGKPLVMSGAMDNREVAKNEANGRGTAEKHIAAALEKFWPIMDSKLSVIPFPKLSPEVARRRVTGVIGDANYSLLRKLAEIRYMNTQGWLSEAETEEAFAIAAEADGMTILYGSDTDAIDLIRDLAARQANLAK